MSRTNRTPLWREIAIMVIAVAAGVYFFSGTEGQGSSQITAKQPHDQLAIAREAGLNDEQARQWMRSSVALDEFVTISARNCYTRADDCQLSLVNAGIYVDAVDRWAAKQQPKLTREEYFEFNRDLRSVVETGFFDPLFDRETYQDHRLDIANRGMGLAGEVEEARRSYFKEATDAAIAQTVAMRDKRKSDRDKRTAEDIRRTIEQAKTIAAKARQEIEAERTST